MMKEYDKAWSDVHTAQEIGETVDPHFIETLQKHQAEISKKIIAGYFYGANSLVMRQEQNSKSFCLS